jgi:hypothetical protein
LRTFQLALLESKLLNAVGVARSSFSLIYNTVYVTTSDTNVGKHAIIEALKLRERTTVFSPTSKNNYQLRNLVKK